MRITIFAAPAVIGLSTLLGLGSGPRGLAGEPGHRGLRALADAIASGTAAEEAAAMHTLRKAGRAGLDALHDLYRERLATSATAPAGEDPALERITAALDAIGQQKDCASSRPGGSRRTSIGSTRPSMRSSSSCRARTRGWGSPRTASNTALPSDGIKGSAAPTPQGSAIE